MPERITLGPGGKLKALAIMIPNPVIKTPKIMLKLKKDFRLQDKLRAETAGKIVSAPISTEPMSLMPRATLKAKSKRKPRYEVSGLASIDFAKSGATMLSVNRRERIKVKTNMIMEVITIIMAS